MKLCNRYILLIFLCMGTHSVIAQPGKNTNSAYNKTVSDTLPFTCSHNDNIEKIINDAISLGAPIYNAGLHIECYRIYEWAAYKIIYVYGSDCKEIGTVLKIAVDKSHGDYSDIEKAWMMRAAFDKILGVPTQTSEPEKELLNKNG